MPKLPERSTEGPDLARPTMGVEHAGVLDLAVVGGGVGGAYVAWRAATARPDWRIGLFEATARIGGRLLSLPMEGAQPVRAELGGMRFRTSQPLISEVVNALALETRPFHTLVDDNRLLLRGHAWRAGEPERAALAYDLPPELAGRTPAEVLVEAFERAVPGALRLTDAEWADVRHAFAFRGRLLRDWSLGELLAEVLDHESHQYVVDGFGYRTVLADRNAADAIPWVLIEARPEAENQTLVEGMERLPRALAAAFEALGGTVATGHRLAALSSEGRPSVGVTRMSFDAQPDARANRVVLSMPPSALGQIDGNRAPRNGHASLLATVTAASASKLFLAYEGAWWRSDGFAARRTITDLPLSKTFYFDLEPDGPSAVDGPALLLASYADGTNRDAWVALAGHASTEDDAPYDAVERWDAHPASAAQLAAAAEQLAVAHPAMTIPKPVRSAFVDWSEGAWHTWNAGVRSDEVMAAVVQSHEGAAVWVCGEAFSASQGWVEGALESAERVLERLLSESAP